MAVVTMMTVMIAVIMPFMSMAAMTLPLVPVLPAAVMAAALGFIRPIDVRAQLVQQAVQLRLLFLIEGGEEGFAAFLPAFFHGAGRGLPLRGEANVRAAAVLLIGGAGDPAVFFQLAQHFAQRAGPHGDDIHQLALGDAAPPEQQRKNAPLAAPRFRVVAQAIMHLVQLDHHLLFRRQAFHIDGAKAP